MRHETYICMILLLSTLAFTSAVAEEPVDRGAGAAPERATQTTRPAADALQLDITSIRGNQELPRVMVIVPWKDPSMGNLVGKPVNSLIDEVLRPLDRDVFRRQTNYFDQLYAPPGAAADE